MLTYTPSEYTQPGFVEQLRNSGQDRNYCQLVLDQGVTVKLPVRVAMINILYWEPLFKFGILPTEKELCDLELLSTNQGSKIYTKMYERFLDVCPEVDHILMVRAIFDAIGKLYNFVTTEFGAYMPSVDALSLAKMLSHSPLKELANRHYSDAAGTRVAEKQLKEDARELKRILLDPNTPDNILYYYMKTGVLKDNSVSQMILAYGPRSDIDDTMRKHIISSNSFSGLRSVEDFATESLSAKKSGYYTKDIIPISQYFARKSRLVCSTMEKVYPGSCGATNSVIPITINEAFAKNFLYKVIIDDGKRVQLNSKRALEPYIGKTVQMVTPIGCRHLDGFCEACAGYAKDRLLKYIPPHIHIGMLASSKMCSTVSQKVLSAKHLISTDSQLYELPAEAKEYFRQNDTGIYFDKRWSKQLKDFRIRIPADEIGHLVDLNMEQLPSAVSFSKLSHIWLLRSESDESELRIPLKSDGIYLYLSPQMLVHMRRNLNKIDKGVSDITVPLAGFSTQAPLFEFIITTADMVGYIKSVSNFLEGKREPKERHNLMINGFTSVSEALQTFAEEIIWKKNDISIFFLEVVLRNYLITAEDNWQLPIVDDMNHVHFGTLPDVVTHRTLSMKLAFERLMDYIGRPAVATQPRAVGFFGPFFGILK